MSTWVSQGVLKGATGAAGTTLWSGLTGTPPALSIFSGPPPAHGPSHLSTDPSGGTSISYDYDDFNGAPKWLTLGNSGGAAAFSAASLANFGAGHNGNIALQAGTTVSNWSRAIGAPIQLAGGTITIRALVRSTSTGASPAQHLFGLTDTPSAGITSGGNYVIFYYIPSSNAFWNTETRNPTSAATFTGAVTALNAWVDLKIIATASSIGFYVNGTLITTITTFIPASTTLLYPFLINANGADTNNYVLYCDDIELQVDTGITGKFMKTCI